MIRFALVNCMGIIACLANIVGQAPLVQNFAKLPPYERLLKGEDAKKAEKLQKAIGDLQEADKYAEAMQLAEELLGLRTKLQEADHHETIDAKHNLAALTKVAALPEERRLAWRAVMKSNADARTLREQARYAEALALDRKILEWRREVLGEDHPDTATSYNSVSFNLNVLGKSAEAQPLFQKALKIRRRVLGEDHPSTTFSYNNLASNLEVLGKVAEAQPLYQTALTNSRRIFGDDHSHTATCYNNLGALHIKIGKFAEAQLLFEKALKINRQVHGDDHSITAKNYVNLAFALQALGKPAEAQPFAERALGIQRRFHGEDHPETAGAYVNLASTLQALGKSSEAHPLFQRSLEINRRVLGDDHPFTGASYSTVGNNLRILGMGAEAQPLFQKSLEITRRIHGEDHPETAKAYMDLGVNLVALKKPAEVQLLFQKALETQRRILGEEHPTTARIYYNMALNLSAQGKLAEAQRQYLKALEIRSRTLGDDHPETIFSYHSVAQNLSFQGKPAEAQDLFNKALQVSRRVFGDDHPDTAIGYNNVAFNLESLNNPTEAQPLFQKALEINRRVFGENHSETAKSYNNFAFNLMSIGKAGEARPLYQKALEINRRVLGEDHSDTASGYTNLAATLQALGKSAEALPFSQKALEINRRVLGEDHLNTAKSYNNLAISLAALGRAPEAKSVLAAGVPAYETSRLIAAEGIDRASLGNFNPRLLLAALSQGDEPERAWGEVELSLGRGSLDRQSESTGIAERADAAELGKHLSSLAAIQPKILFLVAKTNRSEEESTRLEGLLKVRRSVEERLSVLAVKASTGEVAGPAAIRSALAADAALLFWVDVGSKSGVVQEHFACVVRPAGDPHWERLPGTGPGGKWTKEDTKLPNTFREALAANPPSLEMSGLADKLRVQRIAPVLKHLAGVKSLFCVPVHEMAGVPIDVLTPEFTVSYTPSGTYLARLKAKPKAMGNGVLALGDPVFKLSTNKSKSEVALPPGGLLVQQIVPSGGAAKVGIQAGDVILKYCEVEIATVEKLGEAIAANAASKSVAVTVWRDGQTTTKDVPPGKLGVVLAKGPAPSVIADRRKTEAILVAVRGGTWNDLPGTRVELEALKKHFSDKVTVLADSDASEKKLESLRKACALSKFRYLHFATHGEGNSTKAFESSLILAQDELPKEPESKPGEPYLNGQLSAREVLDLWKLDAELVTLSACETAIGKSGGGDGLLGFAQAFLSAGAGSVCLSLWKVDDTATSLLMDRFYSNLKAGKPKAAALHEAKLWLKNLTGDEVLKLTADMTKGVVRGKNQKALNLVGPAVDPKADPKQVKPFEHPRYWAAFILIGDPN